MELCFGLRVLHAGACRAGDGGSEASQRTCDALGAAAFSCMRVSESRCEQQPSGHLDTVCLGQLLLSKRVTNIFYLHFLKRKY